MLTGARLVQGLGAAMMTPAALSILTTTFTGGRDRVKAIGAWSGTIPLASVFGVLLGGLLSAGPGCRWVFLVNVPVSALVIAAALRLLPAGQRRRVHLRHFDAGGAVLSTAGMLTGVYALVTAPSDGWGSVRTIGALVVSAAALAAFAINERRHRSPLVPLSIFRITGLAAADATQVIAQAGFYSMFFLTLYMQDVLGYSPVAAGAAYVPVTIAVGLSSGVATKLVDRIGSRPVIVTGTVLGAAGVFWLSRIPVHGTYPVSILAGLVVMALGLGAVFVGSRPRRTTVCQPARLVSPPR